MISRYLKALMAAWSLAAALGRGLSPSMGYSSATDTSRSVTLVKDISPSILFKDISPFYTINIYFTINICLYI
jgi:hypothetical protein